MELRGEWPKALALVVSAIWLLCLGPGFSLIMLVNICLSGQPWQEQWKYAAAYLVLGLLPVYGITGFFKKFDDPISPREMIVLAICAASPLWFLVFLITLTFLS